MAEQGADDQVVQDEGPSEEVVAEARKMGWAPKEQWRGPENQWIDANEFVRRGREVLPLIKQQKQQLESEIAQLRSRDQAREAEFRALKASLSAIEESQQRDVSERAEQLREEMVDALEQASEAGDHKRVAKLTSDISKLDAATVAAARDPATNRGRQEENRQAPPATEDPHYLAWKANNPWFGVDQRRSTLALAAAQLVKGEQPALVGTAFYDAVEVELSKLEGTSGRRRTESRVAGGESSGGERRGEGGNGKSYADLPAEAKEVCQRQAKMVVGTGKAYKDMASWQKAYAKTYFEEE